tara:strand:- start:1004 stop:1108 length:105 start_codon:yes stop_codon:yes gene_type:complete
MSGFRWGGMGGNAFGAIYKTPRKIYLIFIFLLIS